MKKLASLLTINRLVLTYVCLYLAIFHLTKFHLNFQTFAFAYNAKFQTFAYNSRTVGCSYMKF